MKIISLKTNSNFKHVNEYGSKFINKNFIMILDKNNGDNKDDEAKKTNELNILYLGFKITAKIFNAVKRNKLRRQVKHVFRSFADNSDLGKYLIDKSVLFIARHGIAQIDYTVLNNEIHKAVNYFKNKEQYKCLNGSA